MTAPELSVVVVTRGPSLTLARFLRSLGRAAEIERIELLVGLNGGGGADTVGRLTGRFLAGPTPVRLFELPKSSPAGSRNEVVREASAPILIFLDDDVEVPRDLLRHFRETMSDQSVAVAGGPNLTPPSSPEFERLAGRVLGSALGAGPVRARYTARPAAEADERSLILCNLAVRRSAFADFDADLACAEENELLARLTKSGARMVYRPELAVFHHRRPSLNAHLRQMLKYGFGRGQLLARTFSAGQTPYALPALALACLVAAAALQPSIFALALAGYLALLAAGSVRLGSERAGTVFTLFLATHFGYASGVAAGFGYELRRLVRRVLKAGEGRLGQDVVATFGALLLAVGFGVGSGIVMARTLGPQGRGLFELSRTLAMLIALPAGLGLGSAAVFLRPRGRVSDAGVYGAVTAAFGIGSAIGGLVAALLLATEGWHPLDGAEIALVSASIPLIAFFTQGQSALRGLGRAAWFRRTTASRDALFLVFLVVALSLHVSVRAVLVAWAAHWVVSALFVAGLLVRACGRPQAPRGAYGRLASFGSTQAAVALLTQAHLRLDVFVLQAVQGSAKVGLYAVAFGIADVLTYGGRAISFALFPRTAVSSSADPAGGARRTAKTLRVVLLLSVVAAVLLELTGPFLIEALFGRSFAPAGDPLRALLPGAVAMVALLVLQSDLSGRGRVGWVAATSAAAVVANLGLNLALVPSLGTVGAALASSSTYSLAALTLLVVFSRTTGVSLRDCLIARRRDAHAAAATLFGNRREAAARVATRSG